MLAITEYEQVIRIKLSRYPEFNPPTYVCTYFVDDLLIDGGPACTAQELVDFLRDRDVSMVVNIHYHEDHIAANALLKERYGVELLAPQLAVNRINRPPVLYPYQKEVWGHPTPSQVKGIGDTVLTKRFRFEVVHTPGHSPDHICLFEPERGWLFSGDLYFSTHPRVARPEENQWQTIASLKKVRDLMPRVLFPATANVILEPTTVLEEAIHYLEDLGQKVAELFDRGLSPVDIRQELFGAENLLAEFTQHQFSSLNLISGYLKTT